MTWTTLSILDEGGTARAMRVWDESGAGTGPYMFAKTLYDEVNDTDAVGQVQETPTVYTLLGRMKAVEDAVAAVTTAVNNAAVTNIGGFIGNPSDTITRPANATAYDIGDLIADNVTAGSASALAFANAALSAGGSFIIKSARLSKDSATTADATFRLHLFTADPFGTAPTGGDNAALELNSVTAGEYVDYIDLDASTAPDIQASDLDAFGTPSQGDRAVELPAGTTLYGVLEARAAYIPASGEVFTITMELLQDA